ncbi:D-3-phosphoglycerate dehydrogenase [Kineococcus radiotolerans]|uniref:D-3-phosphoglycerate dehydrogenase n=1 Tax=Kineococcus radiotolerans TaxID=131568 RepID=A0A7W4TLG3_KINRA|nr:D-isomer specific 2-hydroxyacid dehydrogenase family protein [Kineococcus radiotolerans]MBB2900985.1 D-3-phosphoglycerate dehydrogenase [Kineococcus radiotolerans]
MPTTPAVYVGPQENPQLVEAVERGGGRVVALAEAEAVVVSGGHGDLPELPAAVRWVQLPSAGIEAWVESGVVDSSRTWTSATGAYSHAVAEGAVALLLAGVRGIGRAARLTTWDHATLDAAQTSLRGSTIAVVGAGGIGSAMIPAFVALGAEVLAVTRRGLPVEGAARTLPADRVGEVFAAADHVVLAAPATERTKALVGAEQLAAIGAQGWLVNIARGSLVDTDALVSALAEGTIAGAALDVTDPEPLPDGHPLWSEPRCIITPHSTNPTPLQVAALAERVAENVRRFAAGEELLGLVDPERGY